MTRTHPPTSTHNAPTWEFDATVSRWVQDTASTMTDIFDQVDADGLFPDRRDWDLAAAVAMLLAGEDARRRFAPSFHLVLQLRWPMHARFSRRLPDLARYRCNAGARGFTLTPPALYLTRGPWPATWHGEEHRVGQVLPAGLEGLEAVYVNRLVGDDEWDRITLIRLVLSTDQVAG